MPPVPAAGVPAKVAVLSPLSTKVTPRRQIAVLRDNRRWEAGRCHGEAPGLPTVKVVLEPEVMAAGWSTDSVKDCVAVPPTPLFALSLTE